MVVTDNTLIKYVFYILHFYDNKGIWSPQKCTYWFRTADAYLSILI